MEKIRTLLQGFIMVTLTYLPVRKKTAVQAIILGPILAVFVGLGVLSVGANAVTSPIVQQPHIQVALTSDVNQAVRGGSFNVGIALEPDPHWHVYWRNPGDSGIAPSIQWTLPSGVSAGEILWPFPSKIPVGPLANYGYHHRVVLPVKIAVPNAYSETNITLVANVSWLVCKESCVPGKAILNLEIPVAERPVRSSEASEINAFMARVPTKVSLLGGSFVERDETVSIELYTKAAIFRAVKNVEFFPINESVFEYAPIPDAHWRGNVFNLSQNKSSIFQSLPKVMRGILVLDHSSALEFEISQ